MKRCIVGIRRPGTPTPPHGKGVPTVWFPPLAAEGGRIEYEAGLRRQLPADFLGG